MIGSVQMENVRKAGKVWMRDLIKERASKVGLIEVPELHINDYVEVVRCKDCKHGRLYEPNCIDCEYMELARDADWFCADGERKVMV